MLLPETQTGLSAFGDPSLLYDGSIFRLWISGGGFVPGNAVPGVRTYYYTSPDGLSWQSHPINPVFREGTAEDWDSGHIETPCVIVGPDGFRLYYAATPDSAANEGGLLKFGLATSVDGVIWERCPDNPILERGEPESWEGRWIESPCVMRTDSLYFIWYSGVSNEWQIQVGLATSTDGIRWQKYTDNPVFSPSRGSDWDSVGVYAPQVRLLRSRFVMLYTGLVFSPTGYDFSKSQTGLAVSDDGIHWVRASDRPVLSGTLDDWDAAGPFTLDWVETNNQLHLIYVSSGKVGAARSTVDKSGVHRAESKLPATYVVRQNYPNPFNPTTTIFFQLPLLCYIEISIYNTLGQLIRTLSEKSYSAGSHTIEWDGKDDFGNEVVSGIYFYNLKVGDSGHNGTSFSETKKMILMR